MRGRQRRNQIEEDDYSDDGLEFIAEEFGEETMNDRSYFKDDDGCWVYKGGLNNHDNRRIQRNDQKIKAGKSLVVTTRLRAWRIPRRTLPIGKKAGRSLLKNSTQGGFYIARGKSFDYVAPCGCAVYFE